MYKRLWDELVNTRFYLEYLGIHINQLDKRNKWIDNISLLTSIGSIAGWYKWADKSTIFGANTSTIFASILMLLNGAKLMKSKFLISDSEIMSLKAAYEFYIDHVRKLEDLWLDHYNNKIDDEQAKKKFEILRDEERMMMKITKHSKVEPKKAYSKKAKQITDDYLNNII